MSSNLKKTRYRESVSRRGRERLRKANRRFDLCAAALALLILIAMAICFRQEYELGSNQPSGFAMWFLLFLAYLPLELVGLVSWLFHAQDSSLMQFLVYHNPPLGLGIFDLGLLAVVWAVIRFYCSRRYGANWMRTAATFLTILVAWGAFQLGCVAAVLIWRGGGFSPLHRHLQREAEPEKVIVVEREAVSAAERTPEPVQKNP